MSIEYTDKQTLADAYERFYHNADCMVLKIKARDNFKAACSTFNSLFRQIDAAGGIVKNHKAEYLFIKRFGYWDLPKGKLNVKETSNDGALREVMEETGLHSLTIIRKLPSTFHIYTDRQGVEILKQTHWFEMECPFAQPLLPQYEEDITEVRWFSAAELNVPMQHTYASLKHLLANYFRS